MSRRVPTPASAEPGGLFSRVGPSAGIVLTAIQRWRAEAARWKRDERSALFRNEDLDSEQHPELRDDGIVNGEPVWISAWVKTSSKTIFSLSFKSKNDRPKVSSGEVRPSLKDELDGSQSAFDRRP